MHADGVERAFALAQRASDAFLGFGEHGEYMNVALESGWGNGERLGAADGNAQLARAAKARVDHGLFPLRAGHGRAGIAISVQNRALLADAPANAAGNATAHVDSMPLFRRTVDGLDGAELATGGAPNAVFRDRVRHKR